MTPKQIAEAVVLRAAGCTLVVISDRLGVSVRSLQRAFQRHGTRKGTAAADMVALAKQEMLDAISVDEAIKSEAARLVADDLAHVRLLREKMAAAAEKMVAGNLDEAVLVMRAAAAYSTAIKNTSQLVRQSLRFDRVLDQAQDEHLPELMIRELSEAEVTVIRSALDATDDSDEDREDHVCEE